MGFYFASDSSSHTARLSGALYSAGGALGWKMFSNPVLSNCSDGSSSDAVIDILVRDSIPNLLRRSR